MKLRRVLDLRRLGSVAWLSSSPAHADASPLQLEALRRVLRFESARLRAESDLVSSTSILHELRVPSNRLQLPRDPLSAPCGPREQAVRRSLSHRGSG